MKLDNKLKQKIVAETTKDRPINSPSKVPHKVSRAFDILKRPQIKALLQFDSIYEQAYALQQFADLIGISKIKAAALINRKLVSKPTTVAASESSVPKQK